MNERVKVVIADDNIDFVNTLISYLQKEEKITNLVIGYVINVFAFLWCYGPKENQNFVLTPLDE